MIGARKGGFTLIELMISLSVILITIGLLLPGLYGANKQAIRTQCANNLKQAAQVLNAYASNEGKYPDDFKELAAKGYVSDLAVFGCPSSPGEPAWDYKAAGRTTNSMKASEELIRCGKCDIVVYADTHVEFLD